MSITTEEELQALKQAGKAVATTIKEMEQALRPGVTTKELDEIGRQTLEKLGAQSAPKKCYNFPGYTCISINEEAAHGIPSDRVVQAGDLVNIDVSAELNGFYADMGATFPVEVENPRLLQLCKTSKKTLQKALAKIKAGAPIDILKKIYQQEAERHGFSVVRNLCGHGLGKSIHEKPNYVPDFSRHKDRRKFTEGLVVAIEPFIATGHQWVDVASDGWALIAPKGQYTAQFEHTIVVTKNGAIVVTTV